MRILLGIILGAVLTIGTAYLYDSGSAPAVTTATTGTHRPLVNWDVVGSKWQHLSVRARAEWQRLAG